MFLSFLTPSVLQFSDSEYNDRVALNYETG